LDGTAHARGPADTGPDLQASLERTTGFEPATPTLARWCSTAEPRPRNFESRRPRRGASTVPYRVPVDPNPPSPRLEGGSSSTHNGPKPGTATITSCAIRSPRAILTLSPRSRFTTEQISSPRYPASMRPGAFASVSPCLDASPLLGSTRPACPLGIATATP